MISIEDWAKINKFMHQLAKRKDPDADSWVFRVRFWDEYCTCIVCGESIHYNQYIKHALKDLKEHNLLSFL